jgi:hypothetical protein
MRTVALLLSLATLAIAGGPRFRRSPDMIEVHLDGQPFTAFHLDAKWDKPFLHPLRSASGEMVTRGWPVDPLAGDSNDHTWHRGLWYSHGAVNGVDFWREKPGETGKLVLRGAPKTKGEELSATLDLMPPKGPSLGTLRQQFTFRSAPGLRMVDVTVTYLADRGQDLTFGDTEEGALGLRFTDDFRLDRGARMSNSEGITGRPIWGKPAKWTDYAVTRGAKTVGVTILDHPGNPRHPTYWHARHYGLNSANPFGVRDFTGDKSRDGKLVVPKGGQVQFRYRVVIHEGGDPAALFQAFAATR